MGVTVCIVLPWWDPWSDSSLSSNLFSMLILPAMIWCYSFLERLPHKRQMQVWGCVLVWTKVLPGLGTHLIWLGPADQDPLYQNPRFSGLSTSSALCRLWTTWPLGTSPSRHRVHTSTVFAARYPAFRHTTVLFLKCIWPPSHTQHSRAPSPRSTLNWTPLLHPSSLWSAPYKPHGPLVQM